MRVLLTGGTGFVGHHLHAALVGAGYDVVCSSRDPQRAARTFPDREWVAMDVEDAGTIDRAVRGVAAAFYLVHGMGQGHDDYPQREAKSAENFATTAKNAGLERLVYLGGVIPPQGAPSKHLRSRARTGEILRRVHPSAVEVRAAMIVGNGSASWVMTQDLARRLPAMLLPSWLKKHSHPVGLEDVVWALVAALRYPGTDSRIFEVPGPERISHKDVLLRAASLLGSRPPMISVPVLTPRLSSYWIAMVTSISLEMARELVEGVRHDLDPSHDILWDLVSHKPQALEQAAQVAQAIEEGRLDEVEYMKSLGASLGEAGPWTAES